MRRKFVLGILTAGVTFGIANAQTVNIPEEEYQQLKEQIKREVIAEIGNTNTLVVNETTVEVKEEPKKCKFLPGLQVGGYGEAVYSYNFFSDHFRRYSNAAAHKDDHGHGRFDLPHVVIWLGYDFGKGWSMGTEIEFEHGGTESAVEIEAEETGEYESEVERGGEVALEQFWLQKSFCPQANIRVGHMVVPVGATNNAHLPTEFFGVYRPEGENTILPCTWHETGITFWGRAGDWRYEAMLMPGLDSDRFGTQGWIHDGAGSPYEFKIGNTVSGAVRVDNYSVKGLRLSLSGYIGNSFINSLGANNPIYSTTGKNSYDGVKGTVAIGAFDFLYKSPAANFIARGNVTYGHLSDAKEITTYNNGMRNDSPSPKQPVGSSAIACGIEAGYNIFSFSPSLTNSGQKLYIFGRYDYYDSMHTTDKTIVRQGWCERQRVAVGVNYFPISKIVIKGEYAIGLLKKQYNNEPSISVGIAYAGLFN